MRAIPGLLVALAAGPALAQIQGDPPSDLWPFGAAFAICSEAGRDMAASEATLRARGFFIDGIADLGPFQRHLGGFGLSTEAKTHVSISEQLHPTHRIVHCTFEILGLAGPVDLDAQAEAVGLTGRTETDAHGAYASWELAVDDVLVLVQVTHTAGDFRFHLTWVGPNASD